MKLPLSNRLLACCSFIAPGDRVADIGCDHGYLGIHLLQSGIASSVIASDINENPLLSAKQNARKFHTEDRMAFFLSAGAEKIPRDFDTLVCAGMGADTMMGILDAAPWLKDSRYRLVLQCQSKRPELRMYLNAQGYAILRETLAKDGKFIYPVMEVKYSPGQLLSKADYYITPVLRASGSPLLPAFEEWVIRGLTKAAKGEHKETYTEIITLLKSLERSCEE